MKKRILFSVVLAACLVLGTTTPGHAARRTMKEKGSGVSNTEKCAKGSPLFCWQFDTDADGSPIKDGHFKGVVRLPKGGTFENNQGKMCRPMDGTGTFRKGDNRIHVAFEGTSCSGKSPNHVGRAYASVIGGTGDYVGAKGKGALLVKLFFDDGEHPFSFEWEGTLKT